MQGFSQGQQDILVSVRVCFLKVFIASGPFPQHRLCYEDLLILMGPKPWSHSVRCFLTLNSRNFVRQVRDRNCEPLLCEVSSCNRQCF